MRSSRNRSRGNESAWLLWRTSWTPRKHLARRVHDQYFNPPVEKIASQTVRISSNAFTSAFNGLDSIPQFKTTAKLAPFLEVASQGTTTLREGGESRP